MKKIEKILFYFFVFSTPFQIRKILFFVLLGSRFNEWTTGYLYFTDLLLLGIFILWIKRLICGKSDFPHIGKSDFLLIGFFLIAGLSLITSQNIGLSVYQLIKLAEFIILFLYVKYNLEFLEINKIVKIIIASGTFEALIAILQFFNQSSLGLKHFEAGIYNANIPGVATFFVGGAKFIRAYGTTPHPNVLGIFLLVSIFCIYGMLLKNKKNRFLDLLFVICYLLCVLGLLLTFSRAIILVSIAGSIFFFVFLFFWLKKPLKSRIISLFLLFAICHILYAVLFWPEISARFSAISPEEQAITLRVYYNDIALSIIKEKPILGLGLGNFVWYLLNNFKFKEFWLYQPVHNLYLLVASEIGVFGLIIFVLFIGFNLWKLDLFRKLDLPRLIFLSIISCFLFLGLIDHYLWTIQQSRFLFWLVLAIVSGLGPVSPRSLMDKT